MKFLGGPIHKAIPITDVNTVADIATGTGCVLKLHCIWFCAKSGAESGFLKFKAC